MSVAVLQTRSTDRWLELQSCAVDLCTGAVLGRDHTLSTRERTLLCYLAARPGQLVSRDELLSELWQYSARVVSRAVDSTMCRLREKIEVDATSPRHLVTEYGFGYRFEPTGRHSAPPASQPAPVPAQVVALAQGSVDLSRRIVRRGGSQTPLTTTEARLLAYLVSLDGRVADRAELLHRVWELRTGSGRAVDAAVNRLRAKVESDPARPAHLLTVRGAGYRWQPASAAPAEASVVVACRLVDADRLWDDHAEAMVSACQQLTELVERHLAAAGGVRAQWSGDAGLVAFADAGGAVRWAMTVLQEAPRWPAELGALQVALVLRSGRVVQTVSAEGGVQVHGTAVSAAQRRSRVAAGGELWLDPESWHDLRDADRALAEARDRADQVSLTPALHAHRIAS